MELSERLKIARDSLGKEQKEIALLLNISFRSWQDYEAGKSVPGGKVFESLVKLGFNANWLLTGEGPMKGFTAVPEAERKTIDPDKPAVYLDVIEDVFEEITRIFDRKVGNRRAEISSDKSVTLVMLLARIYSKNFLESAEFRRNTLEKNVEALVKLALPE
ncbi:MAG: helix-turn-helix transcriptional regulator [Desulfuromonadaceae bacterium]|nr:helix-turn-helix transcriptional regulator [Desulfuromonadaceae bacterium]MDD2856911.1 helix-turn-helix transcriptional regulator [Desulfuromonadaceae bacterium]